MSMPAVIDLDGTLTRQDTLLRFFLFWFKRGVLRFGWCGLAYGALKAKLISQDRYTRMVFALCISGMPRDRLDAMARRWIATEGTAVLRPQSAELIQHLKSAGYEAVMLTANFDFLAIPLGEWMNFTQVICTETSRSAPKLIMRGAAKRDQLHLRFTAPELGMGLGIGNEPSDHAFLSVLGQSFYVTCDDDIQTIIDTVIS